MPDMVVRAFELPLHICEPQSAWENIRECWHQATCLANWCVQQLLRADVVRTPGMKNLPRRAPINGRKLKGLYGLASETFDFKSGWWAGATGSAATICHAVAQKYDAERLAVIWHRKQAPCTYRYPYPWPVRGDMWRCAAFDRSGHPCIEIVLPGRDEHAFPDGGTGLRLRGGPEFGRQLHLFRQVVNGDLPRKQVVIRQQQMFGDCHRPTLTDGGSKLRVMIKMVAEIPVKDSPGKRTLVLITDPQAFWVGLLDGQLPWVLNDDHFRRGIALHEAHLRQLQRLGQDAKAERRIRNHRFVDAQPRLERLVQKDRRRQDSWTHEASARLVNYAVRQHVGEVLYLDRDKGFIPRFPWRILHDRLHDKCRAVGINFHSETSLRLSGGNSSSNDSQAKEETASCLVTIESRLTAMRNLLAAQKRTVSHPRVCVPQQTSTM